MENFENETPRTPNPRRRRRSRKQQFMESYLPLVLAAAVVVLLIIFIASAVSRGNERREEERQASIDASVSASIAQQAMDDEANRILQKAEALANAYDFEGAIAMLNTFEGDIFDYDNLLNAKDRYEKTMSSLVAWDDPNKVVNLSTHLLIADPSRAFNDSKRGDSYYSDYITTAEFEAILGELYANGYVLISPYDIVDTIAGNDGNPTYAPKTVYLPEGKKPMILTQTHVNYYTYMVDGDEDGKPDKNGDGFASKLVLAEDGSVTCQMVDDKGATVTGNYDLVPILNQFIAQNPDFSYHGAKAVLAFTTYDGLFGYRTKEEKEQLPALVQALRDEGYVFASYTATNISYDKADLSLIESDAKRWRDDTATLLGEVDMLVFAQKSDLGNKDDDKYDILIGKGFHYFVGVCTTSDGWIKYHEDYIHQGRLLITGSNLTKKKDLFEGLFVADNVLDAKR